MSQIHQALETNVNGQNVTAEDTPMLWPIADACSRRRMIVGSILGLGSWQQSVHTPSRRKHRINRL